MRLRLHHPGFYSFSKATSRLRREAVAEDALDDVYVDRFLRAAERYRYQMSAAPVSFSHDGVKAAEVLTALQADAARIDVGWQSLGELSLRITSELAALVSEDTSPYLECAACATCKPGSGREAMVVCPTDLLAAAREVADDLIGVDALDILAPSELKHSRTYDRLLLAGPFSWFARRAPHVLSAPRAPEIISLSYDWLPDQWAPESAFLNSEVDPSYSYETPHSKSCPTAPAATAEVLILNDGVLPSSEDLFLALSSTSPSVRSSTKAGSAPVETRGFILEPASLLLVENDAENRLHVIDFSREIGRQVARMPITEIEPGIFVLHRSAGGGDYIIDLANKILGERSAYLRGRQSLWKDALRALSIRDGYETVAEDLQQCGSAIASYQNVRNWISERNISTNDKRDFEAIMRLTELEDESETLWAEMKEIRRAHSTAGHKIRRMLLHQVAQASAAELLRLGYFEFNLGDEDGGVLTAQRVVEVVDDTPAYPESELPLFGDV